MVSVRERFEHYFSESNLQRIYQDTVVLSIATGIDNLSQSQFWTRRKDELSIISRKVIGRNYRFTKYKLRLISKGRGKAPREISIPTIIDRIALRALCDFLVERYKESIKFELPQRTVRKVKDEIDSGKFDGFIKLDI